MERPVVYLLQLGLVVVMSVCEYKKCLSSHDPQVLSILCTNILLDRQGNRSCIYGGIHVKSSALCTTLKTPKIPSVVIPLASTPFSPNPFLASSIYEQLCRPSTWKRNKQLFLKAQQDLAPLVLDYFKKDSCMPKPPMLQLEKRVHCEEYFHPFL